MQLEPQEITAIAEALAPLVADILEQRLSERPEWAFSISEAAAWARVSEHVIRDAIADERLPCLRVGRSVRVRRCDLFRVKPNGADQERPPDAGQPHDAPTMGREN